MPEFAAAAPPVVASSPCDVEQPHRSEVLVEDPVNDPAILCLEPPMRAGPTPSPHMTGGHGATPAGPIARHSIEDGPGSLLPPLLRRSLCQPLHHRPLHRHPHLPRSHTDR
ncbi:hypothetical protein PVAP13_8NG127502 [Panicum virgatum]|uniref:Uncharacterized protein n=1 Tax=Panicum virgatum TaxID=38727 RepID=A0A8T0PG95_PANVG|nr:hypothetical protein PVAP13_8NG127502 [Panicum virgatum]